MAEPVGDLVVDLSLDAARFDEQMARVRRHFSGTESDAKKTAAVVEQSLFFSHHFPYRKVMRKKQRQSLNSR